MTNTSGNAIPLDTTRAVAALVAGTIHDPHAFLGMHLGPDENGRQALQVRVWAPGVESVTVCELGGRKVRVQLRLLHDAGLFGGIIAGRRKLFPYEVEISRQGRTVTTGDPYRFLPTVGELDLFYYNEGTHLRPYEVLGAHPRTVDGTAGVGFAVWAPHARGVSLIGDFNRWDRRALPMRSLGSSGVWELFVPGLATGERYKFAIHGFDGLEVEKADPFAFASELRPRTASVIAGLGAYAWGDDGWMERRAKVDPYKAPMSIYEVHLGSWRRRDDGSWLQYRELAQELSEYATRLGYTHIEVMPVTEHPYDGSWGYQVTGFYAPTARFGKPDDFRYFVDTLHQAGIGVIMDWVPAHFAVDMHALTRFDGTYLYEHADTRRRFQPDWGTLSFNYGRSEVRNFLTGSALYWLREFHLDGLRVDGVSSMLYLDYNRGPGQWTPNRYGGREHLEAVEFLRETNRLIYGEAPPGAVTIAEESTAWPAVSRPLYLGGLGFGFKWNMGWMHDVLDYFAYDPIYRQYHQGMLTFGMMYAYNENFVLSLSHDEVVHLKRSLISKMPGDEWKQFANLRLLHTYQHAFPGKKLMFMGGEFGQWGEWNHEASLPWGALTYGPHAGVQALVSDLNALHSSEPALHELDHDPAGFQWLDFADATNSIVSFVRRGDPAGDDHIVCVFNFTPVPRDGYRIPVPEAVRYREILNTDAPEYGGSGVGNAGYADGAAVEHHGSLTSMALTLPPLGALFFKPERPGTAPPDADTAATTRSETVRQELRTDAPTEDASPVPQSPQDSLPSNPAPEEPPRETDLQVDSIEADAVKNHE